MKTNRTRQTLSGAWRLELNQEHVIDQENIMAMIERHCVASGIVYKILDKAPHIWCDNNLEMCAIRAAFKSYGKLVR